MKEEKKTGSYYTPHKLIRFMINYLVKEKQDFTSVLEPSAGDGRFLSLLLSKAKNIKAVELVHEKAEQIKHDYAGCKVEVYEKNFLEYVLETKEKFSLIIGNPPYISVKIMEEDDKEKAWLLCEKANLSKTIMQNMWLAFVVGAVSRLKANGSIFFVLPMEFLQVQYAEKLRAHLEKKFNTIHIISFEKEIFPQIEQDVCLVYLTNRKDQTESILYKIFKDEESQNPISSSIIQKNKPLKKWSNAILSDEDITLLKYASQKYQKIDDMGKITSGIVTGSNQTFILNRQQVKEYGCEQYTLPIIQRLSFIDKGVFVIDKKVIKNIENKEKPLYLLNLSKEKDIENLPLSLKVYLERAGEEEIQGVKLKEHYKCANRKPWYGVPILNMGDIIFYKRYDELPKIYYNKAKIYTTDSGYHIRIKENYNAESLVFCFFNSMTLAQCEYNGRYYGGGVSELLPSEFKELRIPYYDIDQKDITNLKELFRRASITEIVNFVNDKTIRNEFSEDEIARFEEIRLKLIKRRSGHKYL